MIHCNGKLATRNVCRKLFYKCGFLDNKEGEITTRSYWLSIIEIKNGVQQIGTSVLLIVSNYILGLIWRNDLTIYLFDSHFIDENGNLSSSGIAALLKFDTLHSLENYVKSLYYNNNQLSLYFKVQFIKIHCLSIPRMTLNVHYKRNDYQQGGREIWKPKKKRF